MNWLTAALGLASAGAMAVALTQLRASSVREHRVARAMHELRNPLHTAMLVAGQPGGSDRETISVHLRRCALALEQFDGGRSGHSGGNREFDAGEVCRDVVAAWPREVTVSLNGAGGPMPVCGDRRLLEQALANVIANAFEHGTGEVTVATSRRGGRARVIVKDQGEGFQAFRLDRPGRLRPRGPGARGHGLAVASTAVGMLGGQLTSATAADGCGVAIELPVAVEVKTRPRGAEAALAGSDAR